MTSLWLDRADPFADDPLPSSEAIDDLVVGAGLTGLATAVRLAEEGRRVAVVEARHVGAVATGHTTAKLSLLQGTHLSRILGHQSLAVARAYVEGNREAVQWLLAFCARHGVDVQRRPAATYAASTSELSTVRREHDAARQLGLDVTWADALDVPFPLVGATVLEDQAQFDPLDVLGALVTRLRELGGTLHQGHRVTGVSGRRGPRVRLEDGSVLEAADVVVATGAPVLDRGLHFARLEPQRSYALAFTTESAPAGMYLSAGSDSRSVRDAPGPAGTRLLVGGSGHGVGRTRSELGHLDRLREWTHTHFPDAVETHHWSAQDYATPDGLPFVGPMPGGGGRVFVATGYEKWGMTNAVAAAHVITARILGVDPSTARPLGRRPVRPRALAQVARMNLGVGLSLAAGAGRVLVHRPSDAPAEGTGELGHRGLVPTGTSTVDGTTCTIVGLCTHLGGVLEWNDAERSWDCPLHGSRFAPDGAVLEGPATTPLSRRDDPVDARD